MSGGRVLVARLDSMGDILLTGGAVRAVAQTADHVTMLVGAGRRDVAALLPGVDHVLEFAAAWVDFDPPPVSAPAVDELIAAVRAGRYDRAVIFTSYHQSPLPLALLLRLAGVGWIGAISEDYPGSLLDLRHRVPDDRHEAERNLSLAEAAGGRADAAGARPTVRGPLPAVTRWTGRRPYVVLHPGAAVPARRPSADTSRQIAAALVDQGHRVLITGSAAEAPLTASVAVPGTTDLTGRLSLPELAAVLARAQAVVAPNTGPAHLAAAVGTPVVSLFAPVVSAANWAPYGVPVVLRGDQQAPCRATRARVCPVPGHPCLDTLAPTEVLAGLEELGVRPARPAADRTPVPAMGRAR